MNEERKLKSAAELAAQVLECMDESEREELPVIDYVLIGLYVLAGVVAMTCTCLAFFG